MNRALGLIETRGLVTAIEAPDVMVELTSSALVREPTGGGYASVVIAETE